MLVTPSTVDNFVDFLANVDKIEAAIPNMEKRLTTITNFYNVAQQFEVSIHDVEMALYKSLFPQFRHLKVHSMHDSYCSNNFGEILERTDASTSN